MGEKLLPPYGGSNRKNATFAFSQKKHTQMQHLNESQRYTIYRMRKDKKTQSEIARYIGVSQATVSKELNRNADTTERLKKTVEALKKGYAKQ